MPDRAFELFDEYAAAYARGERPRAEEYLARAGGAVDELAGLLDAFVASAPVSAAAPSEVAAFEHWLEPSSALARLRETRGLTRAAVVDALIERLGLDRGKREKVRRYYRELEAGVLDAGRVQRRVWDALAVLLGGSLVPAQQRVETAVRAASPSAAELSVDHAASPAGAARRPEPEFDEIDRLFKGG